jgi:hypothetical protein
MNKRLAHVTAYRQRVPVSEDTYLVHEAAIRIADVWRLFGESLPDDRRDWFRR